MHITTFDYELPPELIAQTPADRRDGSRLMTLRRDSGDLAHRAFADLPALLAPGDLLVLNDTRVVAARLAGRRQATGGRWEGLFVREHSGGSWELLVRTRGNPAPGEILLAEDIAGRHPPLELFLVEKCPSGRWLAKPKKGGATAALLAAWGQVPIPPYIREGRADDADHDRYQTIYARHDGAVAAPTAGLHFTPELFAALEARGVSRAFVTLHVGPGTFQPIKVSDVTEHRVEGEWGELPAATAAAVRACKERGGRVVAVGTTSTRLLEGAARAVGVGVAWSGVVDLTVCPPFDFRVIDGLVTNFHLPRSSLLLLVSALAGVDAIRAAYVEAVAARYRFYSYGDAMLIL